MSIVQRSGLRRAVRGGSSEVPKLAAATTFRYTADQRRPRMVEKVVLLQQRMHVRSFATSLVSTAPTAEQDATAETSEAADAPSAITFNIHYATAFGEVVKLVGNGPELGNWNVDKAVMLEWTAGDIWTTTLQLSPEVVHEFKFVVYNTKSKTKKWEDGPNRRLDITDTCPTVDMEWSSLAGTDSEDESEPPMSKEQLEAIAREREEASDLVFQAFARMTTIAEPGSIWAAVKPMAEEQEDALLEAGKSASVTATPEDEFSAIIAGQELAQDVAVLASAQVAEVISV